MIGKEYLSNEELFRILNRNNIDSRGRVRDHHKTILIPTSPIAGFYMPEFDIRKRTFAEDMYEDHFIMNKGYKNLAYILNCHILNANQTLQNSEGTNRIYYPDRASDPNTNTFTPSSQFSHSFNFGSGTNPHDVSRYELYIRHFTRGAGGISWLEEETIETRLQTYHEYSFLSPNRVMGEAGLYLLTYNPAAYNNFLLARAIIDPAVEKSAMTPYKEGWRVTFPANYTRWFLRAYYFCATQGSSEYGRIVKSSAGSDFLVREHRPFAGTPDVRIGRDNTAPSPTDYALRDQIGALSSQSHSVEIDTNLQECRIVRIGTYTPSVNETLGEIGLFTRVNNVGDVATEIMVARGIWDPPVTLLANTTYTIGIVLRTS